MVNRSTLQLLGAFNFVVDNLRGDVSGFNSTDGGFDVNEVVRVANTGLSIVNVDEFTWLLDSELRDGLVTWWIVDASD